jgi:segregation and condensation protein B
MAKRKKNNRHAKNKKGAKDPVEAANATEALADGAASEVDTSVEEEPEAEATADIDQAVESASVPEAEAAAGPDDAPSELASDQLETEVEADANGVVEEPNADTVAEASEPADETGKGKRKNKKGKKAAKGEASATTSDEVPVAPDDNTAEPSAESEPATDAADPESRGDGEHEPGDAENATEPSVEGTESEVASAEGEDEAGEASATADDSASADDASEGEGAVEGKTDGAGEGETSSEPPADPNALEGDRLEAIIESLLFASDKALSLADLKRLLGDRDGKKISAAVQSLIQKRMDTGIQVVTLSTGWHLRTSVDNAEWVSKLLVGKPVRLSRAMMETLAIVAYRQPVTRPEVDDIRGVDCGPVLKTLLDRGLVRIIGKKEEVGRPMLYGTTQEFLRVFNLRDLTELPTLREFYDLSAEDQSKVDSEAPQTPSAITAKPDVALNSVARGALAPEDEDADPLLDELDAASKLAKKALGEMEPEEKPEDTSNNKSNDTSNDTSDDTSGADKSEEPQPEATDNNEPESTPAGE